MQEQQNLEIKISVRNLVEFILRGGDIDNRKRAGASDLEAMQQGSRIHRKIQRQMGSNYQAECPLKISMPFDDFTILVEGRADGIIKESEKITIDEIKGTFKDITLLKEPIYVHQAQAMCYGYIYAIQNELESISVQMTYCNLETEQIKRFVSDYTLAFLAEWFTNLLNEYEKWARYQVEWVSIRNKSIKELEFPFCYREGQHNLATSVYRTILRKKNLFIQAPTGVGKTISTVFPAVKAIGEKNGDKIFYLTAKTITRTVARDAFHVLQKKGLLYKVLTITAKEKMCLCDKMECNPDNCIYAKGHYDRINKAIFKTVTTSSVFERESILEAAMKYQVCPFEFCLDLSLWVDCVICDYNYVFAPNVKLKRFFMEGVKGDYIFLIDEAHNLVERGREMYSAVLYKEDFLEVKREIKLYSRKLEKKLERCNKYLLELKRECESYTILVDINHFCLSLMNVMGEMEKFLEEEEDLNILAKDALLALYLQICNFLNIYESLDENYVIYTEHENDGRFKIKLFCVDTAVKLQECIDKGRSAVFFSATLLPIQYYKSMLSSIPDNYAIYVDSSFKQEQSLLLIGNDVSSKYTRRGRREYEKMATYIHEMLQVKKGKYIVFFPSFKLLQEVYEIFNETCDEDRIISIAQTTGMGEEQREKFLDYFHTEQQKSVVGFCIMGGIFGEGIDLKGENLIGVIIVGTGLPQICNEREILKNYYDRKQGKGFDYGYLYPGMNKVLQAAGRVIRTIDDNGIIILLDERFLAEQYRSLFPKEWEQYQICNQGNMRNYLDDFWKSK